MTGPSMKARIKKIEGVGGSPANSITRIERVVVEPSPTGPRPTGEVYVMQRQPDGTFPKAWAIES